MTVSVSFKEAFKDKTGKNPKVPKSEYKESGDIPVIDQGKIFISGYTSSDNQMVSTSLPVILFGDHTKAVKYVDTPFALGADGVKVLEPQPGFLPKYLYWQLKDSKIPDAGYSRHFKFLKEISFEKPPLEKQEKFVKIRDLQFSIQLKRKRQKELFKELKSAVFHDLFGVYNENMVKLGEVADITAGITKGRKTNQATREVPYLAVANVQAGSLKLDNVKVIEATEAEIEKYRLQKGDIILTEGGDPDKLGRGTVWNDELPEVIHQNHIFRVRLHTDSGLTPDFVEGYLSDPRARKYFLKSSKQTTGIASINKTQLSSLTIPIPQSNFIKKI